MKQTQWPADAQPPGTGGALLDLVLLRSLVAVVDGGSFAAAAERLSLTPSAISGHIRRLEHSVDARLLARSTRRLSLTAAGQALYDSSRHLLALEQQARARLHGGGVRGRLRIGASEDFASTWLPQVLQRFGQWHPQAQVELRVGITADLLRQQARGRLDVVFGKQCHATGGDGQWLWEEPLVWVFAADRELPASGPLPLAAFAEPCAYREAAVQALAQAGRPWRLAFESSSMAGCLAAARAGFAVTVVAASQQGPGLRALGSAEGLPALPVARFCAFAPAGHAAGAALIEAARRCGR